VNENQPETATATSPAEYPKELERDASLKDGTVVHLRPIRPDDAPGLVALFDRLSQQTAYQRFFSVLKRLPPAYARVFANVNYRQRLAIVAERETPAGSELIGVGRYEPADASGIVPTDVPADVPTIAPSIAPTIAPTIAEVAFVVQDGWQGRGLGSILLDEVLRAGVARGVQHFRAFVLADNYRMLGLLARHTEITWRKLEEGVVSVEFRPR
jgi:GNAT superfamily N-acetyltransferase